jgi:hypothetical protein
MNAIKDRAKEMKHDNATTQSQVADLIQCVKMEVESLACYAQRLRERLAPVLKHPLPSDSCDTAHEKPALVPLAQELEDIVSSIRFIKSIHTDIFERIEL